MEIEGNNKNRGPNANLRTEVPEFEEGQNIAEVRSRKYRGQKKPMADHF